MTREASRTNLGLPDGCQCYFSILTTQKLPKSLRKLIYQTIIIIQSDMCCQSLYDNLCEMTAYETPRDDEVLKCMIFVPFQQVHLSKRHINLIFNL